MQKAEFLQNFRKTGSRRLLFLFLLVLYFTVAYAVMRQFGITCVFMEFLGVPCPGCGMTRALLALLRFDFQEAAQYNVVIFFMPYVFLYLFFDLRHRVHNILLGLVAAIAAVNWMIKIILFL